MQVQRIIRYEYQQPEAGFLLSGSSHSHWALSYVVSGKLHAVVDGCNLSLCPGELVLCAPGQFSMCYAEEREAPTFLTAAFDADGSDALPLAGKALKAGAMAMLLEQLAQESLREDSYSGDLRLHLLSAIVLMLCREAAHAPASDAKPRQGENEIIRRAQQHISAHIREKLSVTLVAGRIDVSPSYMTALFHKHLSISPGEYIRRAKLQESKQLIQEGAMNFTEIAAALEYSTVHHFSRQFKEHFGITPTEYAKGFGTKGA